MVNIQIHGHTDYPCPAGWTVERARNEIRSGYGLANGFLLKNGEAVAAEELITTDGGYSFVNFQVQQVQGGFF